MQDLWVAAANRLSELFHSLDSGDYDTLTACFAENGTWARQGKTLKGRNEIRATLASRSTTLKTIHIASNILVGHSPANAGTFRFYLTVYRHDSAAPPPYPVPVPAAVGLCKAEFENDGKEWRIKSLETGPYVFAN